MILLKTNKQKLQTMDYVYYLFIASTFVFLCYHLETMIKDFEETILKDFKETINTIKNNLKS